MTNDMKIKPDPYGLRARNEAAIKRNAADQEARALRLAPDLVAFWTKIVVLAAERVKHGKRPCSYHPWEAALHDVSQQPMLHGLTSPLLDAEQRLMQMAADIAQPGWPEPRRDLIEFALTFLEADVMLFRSGYVKRHFIRRLQQSPLTDGDIGRLNVLIRKAVSVGCGLEEHRAWRKLAAHLVVTDRTPDLADWLSDTARGAIITLDHVDGETLVKILTGSGLTETEQKKLSRLNWFGPSAWGVLAPELTQVVKAGKLLNEPQQKTARSAWSMLDAIRRRRNYNTG